VKLELAPRAVREAERAATWWAENRPAAPTRFQDELRMALDLIRGAPRLGSIYRIERGREYRRVLLPESRFHVYYRVVGPERVRVLAIWSAVRGRDPAL
jgi:plasmid stabilization system protein ParE